MWSQVLGVIIQKLLVILKDDKNWKNVVKNHHKVCLGLYNGFTSQRVQIIYQAIFVTEDKQ